MEVSFKNNAATVSMHSTSYSPRCVRVDTHLNGRTVEVTSTYWPEALEDGDRRAHEAYISFGVKADEHSYEAPKDEREGLPKRATDQHTYIGIEDARALRDELTAALKEADAS
jgi:hypothetical protein